MNPTKSEESFDCVAFKRKAQEEIYEQIKGLSPEAQIQYYRERADASPLGDWWRAIRNRTGNSASPTGRSSMPSSAATAR